MAGGKALSQEYVQDSSDEESSTSSHKDEGQDSQEDQSSPDFVEDSANGDEQTSGAQSPDETTPDTEIGSNSNSQKRARRVHHGAGSSPTKKQKISQRKPTRIPPKTFQPPHGYSPVTFKESEATNELNNMFDDLENKQIWHITAPATLPISSIRNFNIQSALKGETILEHNGIKFHMRRDQSSKEVILRPNHQSNDYAPCSTPVSRNFYLVESQSLNQAMHSSLSDEQESDQFVAHEVGARRLPRKQPHGLLMRYQPYGAVDAGPQRLVAPGINDDSMLNYDATSQRANGVVPSSPDKKAKKKKPKDRSLDAATGGETPSSSAKHSQETVVDGSLSTQSPSKQKSEKKKKHKQKSAV